MEHILYNDRIYKPEDNHDVPLPSKGLKSGKGDSRRRGDHTEHEVGKDFKEEMVLPSPSSL